MIKKIRSIIVGVLVLAMCTQTIALAEEVDAEENTGEIQMVTESDAMNDTEIQEEELDGSELLDESDSNDSDDADNENIIEWHAGWNEVGGNWYYGKANGELHYGWIKLKNIWYYLDGEDEANPGIMACDEIMKIDDFYYAFDANGAMQTGWVERPEGWYYAEANGAFVSGWKYLRDKWYYLNTSDDAEAFLMKSDEIVQINGKYYAFDVNGAMQTGWIKRPEGWYYAETNGAFVSGWKYLRGEWYYLNSPDDAEAFLMKSDEIVQINGKYYVFDMSGAMQSGWVEFPEGWYYANESGDLADGWIKVKGKWYYLDSENAEYPCLMVANETREIDGLTYIFENTGAMKSGWELIGDDWYYYGENSGQIVVDWQYINGYWYYFYSDEESYGIMAKNTIIDGYVLHENGEYVRSRNKTGWQNPSNYPQVSSLSVILPPYCTGYFTYVTPSRISIDATKQECVDAFIARAYEYIGTQYIEPWSSWPGDAVDCSGLVLQCLYACGMDLGIYNPYNHRWLSWQTYNSMNWYHNNTFMPVSIANMQRGDLVYYRGHVAIYLGNNMIIDSWPNQGVSIQPLNSRGAVIGAARPFV